MRVNAKACLILLGLTLGASPAIAGRAAPVSTATTASAIAPTEWRNPWNSVHLRAESCGTNLCGTVVWASADAQHNAAEGGEAKLIGTQILQNFRKIGDNIWKGSVYVPDLRRTFSGTITFADANTRSARAVCCSACSASLRPGRACASTAPPFGLKALGMTIVPIRVGIGGWTFEPWRGVFYPEGLAQKKELEFASRALTAIEINGTYYSTFKPASFAGWAAAAPDGFVFTVKGSRFCTNRKVLAEAGESVRRFVGQGVVELGEKLGPIFWQFMATKRFDADDFAAFLALLPREEAGVKLRHAIQVRNASFRTPEFVDLCRREGVAIVFADSPHYPGLADITADFVYAGWKAGVDENPLCYPEPDIARWARVAETWAAGGRPEGLPYAGDAVPPAMPRETFVFFIHGGKVRAPAGHRR